MMILLMSLQELGVTPWSKKYEFDMEENLFWVFNKNHGCRISWRVEIHVMQIA